MNASAIDAGQLLVTYTLFPNAQPTIKTERADAPWEYFVARVKGAETYLDKKHCPLVSFGEYGEELSARNCIRHAANLRRVFGCELDYDGEQMSLETAREKLQAANIRCVLYTSPSHKPDAPRWRAIFPFAEPYAPEQRADFLARANRILGGIASRESFTLSQSFYIGRVRGAEYLVAEVQGRCLDEAFDIEPLYFQGTEKTAAGFIRDSTTDADLRAVIRHEGDAGERTKLSRYEAMLKWSGRLAARGMEADDIEAALLHELGESPASFHSNGQDPRKACKGLAVSAVEMCGESRRKQEQEARNEAAVLDALAEAEALARDARGVGAEDVAEEVEDLGTIAPPEDPEKEPAAPAPAIALRSLGEILEEKREAEWLPGLLDVLEANVLAVIAAPRSTFKSFIALHWALTTAIQGTPVVLLSAEGAGLDRRADAWLRTYAPHVDPKTLPVLVLERAVNLNSEETMAELVKSIEASGLKPGLIEVDTFSKYASGLDENDNAEVAVFLSRLASQLRERYRCTVLVVTHSGHADAKRPRGASTLMANPDAEYIVTRPDARAMTVTVSRERFKDSPSLDPLAYEMTSVDLGRLDKYERPVTSLVPAPTAAPPIAAVKPELKGKCQRQLLAAVREQAKTETLHIWTLEEVRAMGRGAGMHKNTARAAAEALILTPYFTATIGGWRFNDL